MKVETYTGGPVETNAYLIHAPKGLILIDAPEGVADWLIARCRGQKLIDLLLTHGHYDHMFDAAVLKQKTGCSVWVHRESARLIENPEVMLVMSPYTSIDAVKPDARVDETENFEVAGLQFQTLLCPGHCPGSICYYHSPSKNLFGGDVLFAGGVGRSDLPGGDFDELRDSIRKKLYRLPDDTRVLPGHGPATTIGVEKKTNPFVRI